jgi:glycosyltransferase involved in cell wall biosynthesis
MRIVICWPQISGYMVACWRALAAMPDVDLRIIAFDAGANSFSAELVGGLNCRLLNEQERGDAELIRSLVAAHDPEVLYISGWFHPPFRKLVTDPAFTSVPKWMGVDTPWRGTLRQHLGRLALRSLVARTDKVFVPGERAWQYVRRLGAPESKIRRGLYGVDHAALSPLYEERLREPGGWPRRFLFIGRYQEEKGISTLVQAYAHYRASVNDPWAMGCCGTGPLQHLLDGKDGIENFGFRQPGEIRQVIRQHGAFVLASVFDPWPLVVVESCAAGLPVICTESCGSAVELVRPYYNGITVATADPDSLADAMRWIHHHPELLPEMGRRGTELAGAYSAQAWARRWAETARESIGGPNRTAPGSA